MSQGPSTLGIMITSSLSPISRTSVVRSSSSHGLSSEFTRVQSWQSPKSIVRPTLARPSRAATLLSIWIASSRLPSSTSHCFARSGSLATIFGFDASKKWIIRAGRNGISRSGIGAPIAFGRKKSFALRISSLLVELHDRHRARGSGLDAEIAERALVEILLDDLHAGAGRLEDVDGTCLLELLRQRNVLRMCARHLHVDEQPRHQFIFFFNRRGFSSIRSAPEMPAASTRAIFSRGGSSL